MTPRHTGLQEPRPRSVLGQGIEAEPAPLLRRRGSQGGGAAYLKWMLALSHVIQAASRQKQGVRTFRGQCHVGGADQDVWKRRQKQEAGSRLNSLAVDVPMLRRGQSRGLAPRPSPRQRGASAGSAEASSAFHSPAIRGGGPAQLPAQLTVILASAVARQRGRRKQERVAGASPPTGRARASSAQPCRNQGPKEAGEV